MKKFINFLDGEKERILEQHRDARENYLFEKNLNEQLKPQTSQKNFCQTVTKDSKNIRDIKLTILLWGGEQMVNNLMNSYASKFYATGIPKEISCQIALNRLRPTYKDKNTIIIDSFNKLIYIFDKNNKFIAKDAIISGVNKQSQDAKKIAHALLSWEEACKEEGFVWKDGVGYVDATGKGRKYNPDIIYAAAEKMGSRFFPADIYKTAVKTKDNPHYAGGQKNVLNLFKLSDNNKAKEISIAIHGYYLEQPRKLALDKARRLLGDPSNPSVSKEFLDAVGAGKINLSQSYGCINLSEDFIPILNKYITDSYIFNISEDRQNYLVDNSSEFLKKNQEAPTCLSPESFNAETVGNWV